MKAVGASSRVFELLDDPTENRTGVQLQTLKGEIQFSNVSFSYPTRVDKPVLNDVSFSVHKGQVIALVGPSGSG
jgi:ABC-type multidrug transport system fused ATPase/permease subunit